MLKTIDVVAAVLLVIGGLNWGLVGFLDFNLVTFLFGQTILTTAVYGLVFLSALWQIIGFKAIRLRWQV